MSQTYRRVYLPDHEYAQASGHVHLHRTIAERALGRAIDTCHPVHHVNGDTTDNRPCNLVVCEDDAYHKLLHARTRALEASGDADAVRCWVCRRWGEESELLVRKHATHGYHKSCSNLHRDMRDGGASKQVVLRHIRSMSAPPVHQPAYKLTEEDVRTIKQELADGRTGRSLAKEYGVTEANISCIKNGKTWRNVG